MLFLTQREETILNAIMNNYIKTGEPIGSATIAKSIKNEISSATIRNTMADLEEQGFLFKPHFTSGRIPTEKAFRYYIEHMAEFKELGRKEKRLIESISKALSCEIEEIMIDASRILAILTNYMGIVVEPKFDMMQLKEIEFVKLSKHTLLVVLVTTTGIVETRIVEDEFDLDKSFLKSISNYLNERFEGLPIRRIKEIIAEEIRQHREDVRILCKKIMEVFESLIEKKDREIYIEGKTKMLGLKELYDINKLKEIFTVLEKKEKLLELLDRCSSKENFHIIMGNDWEIQEFKDLSIVTSTYEVPEGGYGVVGILGPMRMDYKKMIPIVSYMAKTITGIFKKR